MTRVRSLCICFLCLRLPFGCVVLWADSLPFKKDWSKIDGLTMLQDALEKAEAVWGRLCWCHLWRLLTFQTSARRVPFLCLVWSGVQRKLFAVCQSWISWNKATDRFQIGLNCTHINSPAYTSTACSHLLELRHKCYFWWSDMHEVFGAQVVCGKVRCGPATGSW